MVVAITALLAVDGCGTDCDLESVLSETAGETTAATIGWRSLVEEAFTPNRLMQVEGDQAMWVSQSSVYGRRAPPAEGEGLSRIVGYSLANKAAMVKAQMRWNGRRYTDYMLLLNSKGEWRITNKIATWEKLND